MGSRCRFIQAAALLLASACAAWGSPYLEPGYVSRTWDTDDGLPQASVVAIAQSDDGSLWLGTFGGLARFNGYSIRVYDIANTPGLPSNRIRDLESAPNGVMWIATESGPAVLRGGVIRALPLAPEWGTPEIHTIECSDEAVYFASVDRVLEHRDGRTTEVLTPLAQRIRAMHLTDSGTLWIARQGAELQCRTPSGWERHVLPLSLRGVTSIVSKGDELLCSTAQEKLFTYDPATRTVTESMDAGRVQMFTRLGSDIWMAGTDGVWGLDVDSSISDRRRRLVGSARSVYPDRDGLVWVGSEFNGLIRIRPSHVVTLTAPNGAGCRTLGIGPDGRAYVSYHKDGLYGLSGRDSLQALIEPSAGPSIIASDGSVWLHRDEELWVHDLRGGVRLAAEIEPAVSAMVEAPDGSVWLGTMDCVCRVDDSGLHSVHSMQTGERVLTIVHEDADRTWVGTTDRLLRFEGDRVDEWTWEDGLPRGEIRAIHIDSDGDVWIGAYGGGLARFRDGDFGLLTIRHGLIENVVSTILEDSSGVFWMNGNRGVSSVQRSTLNEVLDGELGRAFVRLHQTGEGFGGFAPGGGIDDEGMAWFPTVTGVAGVDTKQPSLQKPAPPRLSVTSVLAGGRPASPDQRIELPTGRRSLQVQFVSVYLRNPELVRYRYMLEGFDDAWRYDDGARVASYGQLPPGRYDFHLEACDEFGRWVRLASPLAVHAPPHFYETAWFIGAAAGFVVFGAAALYNARVRRLRRRARALEGEIEAKDMMHSRQQLIINEIDHRVRNNLGAVLTLVSCVPDDAPAESLKESLSNRIHALARANTRLSVAREGTVDLREIVEESVAAYAHAHGSGALRIEGPGVLLDSRMCTPLAMTLNELATNAFKHGALAREDGRLDVTWSHNAVADEIVLDWVERSSGAREERRAPTSSTGRGFTLMRGFVEHELRGSLEVALPPEGLTCRMRFPLNPTSI